MSYHKLKIHKHSVESPYKIQEEFLEYIDAIATGNKIMAIQELSDLYGCLENEVAKFGLGVHDLKVMSDVTKKVFLEGSRVSFELLSYLKANFDSIKPFGLGFIQVKCGDTNYNFYHRDVVSFKNSLAPHSHQQDFVSEVIKGLISESLYEITDGDLYAYTACSGVNENRFLGCKYTETIEHKKGGIYLRLKDEYHSVKAKHGTVTKVTKYGKRVNAYVVSEEVIINELYIDEKELWEMVEEVCNV